MPLTSTISVNDCLNRAAAEVGIAPVTDPYASSDATFTQMRYLLQTAGEELAEAFQWEHLLGEHQFTTDGIITEYDLPDDFSRMINQTGWEQTNNLPLGGPLTAQEWTYLKGRDLAKNTLYPSFRFGQGKMWIYPDPPPAGLDITFEYQSKNWLIPSADPNATTDTLTAGGDTILFHRTLITRYLKVKFLESGGFDTTKAQDDFTSIFAFLTGSDKGAPILNAGTSVRAYPYIGVHNIPDTGYGL